MQTECPHCNTVFRVEESVFTANNPYNAASYPDENITNTVLNKVQMLFHLSYVLKQKKIDRDLYLSLV